MHTHYCSIVSICSSFFFLTARPPPRSTLFPYTTLFRSSRLRLTFTEGRKHEVKRYCQALGHPVVRLRRVAESLDRKSTRLNSSHANISYAVFCLKKKKKNNKTTNSKTILQKSQTEISCR